MAQSVADLCDILHRPKRLVSLGDWSSQDRQYRITAALEADEIILPGVSFMMVAARERPDERVAITLLAEAGRKPRAFARIDWRGSRHVNTHRWCGIHQLIDAGRTHFHDPALHRHIDYEELFAEKVDLPVALPIIPEPAGFAKLLAISSDLLHIENTEIIPVPPWSPQASFL